MTMGEWGRGFAAAGIVAGAMFLGGCETSTDSSDDTTDVGTVGGPNITTIGAEEDCGGISATTPSVAIDSKGQPHIAVSNRGATDTVYLASRIGGAWQSLTVGHGSMSSSIRASRLIIPHVEIDPNDRGWVSVKLGTKEFGDMPGQGLWCYGSMNSGPANIFFKFLGPSDTSKGNGNVSLDPNDPDVGVVASRDGVWVKVDITGTIIERGNLYVGSSGEKLRFLIGPRSGMKGVWHIADCGYSGALGNEPCNYQNSERTAAGEAPMDWAKALTYPEVSGDFWHPGIGIDRENPLACYISVYLDCGMCINIYNGDTKVFPISELPVVDAAATRVQRFPPQWAPANRGGAFLCWSRAGKIHIRHVSITGELGPDNEICDGYEGSMMTDKNGRIHLAYVSGDVLKYRLIQTQ